jgi:hypothetical protein
LLEADRLPPPHSVMKLSRMAPILVALVGSVAAASSYAQEPRLTNLAVRAEGGAATPIIAGFSIGPAGTTTVLICAVGPSLELFGAPAVMADPRLELYNSAGTRIAANDDFAASDATVFAAVGAFPLREGSADAALVATLPAGSYTAHVRDGRALGGATLVEVYEIGVGPARLLNLSVQSAVRPGGSLIAGMTVAPGTGPRRVLVRAIGPTLANFGVPLTLADPRLEISAGANRIAENDNWSAQGGAAALVMTTAFLRSGAFPLARGTSDSALLVDLEPGGFTSVARNAGREGGLVMIDIYEAPLAEDSAGAAIGPLAVQDFVVRAGRIGNGYEFVPSLLLAELLGQSAVTVRSIGALGESAGTRVRYPVVLLNQRIEAGQVEELHRRAGPYDGITYDSARDHERFTAEIGYVDSSGREGPLSVDARFIR